MNNILETNLNFQQNGGRRLTGFNNLNENQKFFSGLYVLGGLPNVGKTTFVWQLLEQFAKNGELCFFLSYELTRLQLGIKLMARELFKRNPKISLTATQIALGCYNSDNLKQIRQTCPHLQNLHIWDLSDTESTSLTELLNKFSKNSPKPPIICIDYLQVVTDSDSAKIYTIEEIMYKLKNLQVKTNTTFIIISSFNRANYLQPATFDSFNTTEIIENISDVVWCLQPFAANSLSGRNNFEDRKTLKRAMSENPRKMMLTCLKNRFGKEYDTAFKYYLEHDYFEPCKISDFEKILSIDEDSDISVWDLPPRVNKNNNFF